MIAPSRRFVMRAAWAVVTLASCTGCVPARGGWDGADLARRHPQLGTGDHRLDDLAPHLLAGDGELTLFLCRWETAAPIDVVLPPDASADERDMLRRALVAWADAGLGVRFREVDEATGGIHFRFVQQGDPGPLPSGAGDTIADCAVGAAPRRGDRVDASLVYASIHLRRDQLDLVGLARPLADDERYGAALHELGHALGFASHVASGRSIMRPSPETARHAGAALRAGDWRGDATLAALYAVPSGTVVGRLALSPSAGAMLERFVDASERRGLTGPYSRVGSHGARLFYRAADGGSVALGVRPWPVEAVGEPFVFRPNPRAERMLARDEGTER